MKDPQKFLRAAQKMEVRQLAQKAREIADVLAFHRQHEHSRQARFDSMLDDEERLRNAEQGVFDPFREAEEKRVDGRNDELLSVQTFKREALESQQHAAGNAFDIIAEMQGFDLEETRPHAVKQLPGASSDLFVDTLTDVIENHLEEELTQNKRAITPWKEKVRTALIRQEEPSSSRKKPTQQPQAEEAAAPELSEQEIQDALTQEEELKQAAPSNSALYFRPPSKPKTP